MRENESKYHVKWVVKGERGEKRKLRLTLKKLFIQLSAP
jgi:hypothetical protein